MIIQIALFVTGFVLLIKSADWLVNGASALAKKHHIPDIVIGLTIVAFGTSAPELVVNAIAAAQHHPDIVFGNVIGSNNFNLFLILGISSLINPLAYDPSMNRDIYLLGLGTFILFIAMFTGKKKKLDRWEAIVLLLLYIGYTVYLIHSAG